MTGLEVLRKPPKDLFTIFGALFMKENVLINQLADFPGLADFLLPDGGFDARLACGAGLANGVK